MFANMERRPAWILIPSRLREKTGGSESHGSCESKSEFRRSLRL